MDVYPAGRRDRLIAHVYTRDGRHVQVALYGCTVTTGAGRRTASWRHAVYADTEEPLDASDEEQWHDELVASILSRGID